MYDLTCLTDYIRKSDLRHGSFIQKPSHFDIACNTDKRHCIQSKHAANNVNITHPAGTEIPATQQPISNLQPSTLLLLYPQIASLLRPPPPTVGGVVIV
jgi:hypothetical protein